MSERELETVEEVLERLFNGADITDYGRDEVLEALKSSRPLILEEAAKRIDLVESDLSNIRDDYIEAQRSGRHGGRRIRPEAARQYAHDFGERADATRQCAELVRSLSQDGKPPSTDDTIEERG